MRLNKALFLDLDGTIIRTKSGSEFPKNEDDWKFLPGILNKIKKYSEDGYVICIVSNQGGIEMGHVTHEFVNNRLLKISNEIEDYIRIGINTIYCPSIDMTYDRKPNPGMAYTLALQLNLNLRESIMVGDAESDKLFAYNAGIGEFFYATDFTQVYTEQL